VGKKVENLIKKNVYFNLIFLFLVVFGTKSLLNMIALNKRLCFIAFFLVVHFEKTLFVFLL
jgi:hypothetical protein